jgi:hypothetical protein
MTIAAPGHTMSGEMDMANNSLGSSLESGWRSTGQSGNIRLPCLNGMATLVLKTR